MGGGGGEGHAIGIDLGTTNSCVAVWENDHVEVIVNDQGSKIIPSCVAFTDTQTIVGDAALDHVIRNPVNTIFDTIQVIDIVLIGGSSRIPKVQQLLKDVFKGKELCKGINPEVAVANGAAVLAAVLNGNNNSACKLKDFTLMDVTPLSLGIRTGRLLAGDQNIMSVMIPRNTRIPVKMYRTYGNQEGQAATGFYIFEGGSENTLKNSLLGSFTLNDLPPSPVDELKFEVFFDIDASGILKVSAKERIHRPEKMDHSRYLQVTEEL